MTKIESSNIVITSRVRFARNFYEYPYTQSLSNEKSYEIIERVRKTIFSNNLAERKFNYVDMSSISPIHKLILVEKHLISPEFFSQKKPSAVVLSEDETIGIMINEEDHLRIQCILKGMQLQNALKFGMEIEAMIEKDNKFSFNEKFGYLTSCPTNIGTGLRASLMMHLPALTLTGYVKEMVEATGRLGFTVRGMYGENTNALGDIYQVSNQKTMGISEEDTVTNVINIAEQIVEQESQLRLEMYSKNKFRFEDKVMRSHGVMKNARIISSDESLKMLSDIRLGCDVGIIENLSREKLDFLITAIQPGYIHEMSEDHIEPEERDIKRATIIREVLA